MSKNLTRKGLALGAGLSLVATGFVALPASASGIDNGFVSLAPNSGTSYLVLAGSTFDLKSNVVGSLAGTAGRDLKFFVEDSTSKTKFDADVTAQAAATLGSLTVTAVARTVNTTTATITATHALSAGDAVKITGQTGIANGWYKVQTVSTTVSFTITTAETTALSGASTAQSTFEFADVNDVDVRDAIVTSDLGAPTLIGSTVTVASSIGGTATTNGRLANGTYVVDTNDNQFAIDRVLRLVNTDSTVTTSVTVTAWVDDNNNGAIDSTEYRSPARTITFHKNADLTVTTTLDQPAFGASTVTGTVAISPELNGQQVGNTDVTATATLQSGTATVTSTYNSTTKVWDISTAISGAASTVVVGNYALRASVAATAIGNTASASVGTRVAADTRVVIAGTNDSTYARSVTGASTAPSKVRPGKSATLVVTAFDSLGAALPAGKSVTVDLSAATTGVAWTINGTTVLASTHSGTGSRVYTTDAKGQVSLEVRSSTALNGHTITIEVRPENLTAGSTDTAKVSLTYETATYAIVDLNAPVNGSARNVVKGGSVTYNLAAVDQYNAKLTGAYRLYITNSGRTSSAANVDFANGVATWTVQDAQLGSSSTITVSAQLQKQTSGVWANSTDATAWGGSTITAIDAPTSAIVPTRTYVDGTDAGATATYFDLSELAIVNYHHKVFQGSYDFPESAAYDSVTLSLDVGISAGDVVTVSGQDLSFAYVDVSDSNKVLAVGVGTLTFVVDATSDLIRVHSNKIVKDAVVTMTANGRSGTVLVTSGKPGQDTATSFDLSGTPASATPGSTFQVVVTLKDDFGNPVDTSTANRARVTYTGPGIVFGQLPTETDANGQMKFAVLLGANDRGTATVMAFYDLGTPDGDSTDLYEFSTSKSVTVGAASVATGTSVKRTGNSVAVKVTGANARIVLNGVRVASRSTEGVLTRTLTLRAGRNVIQLVVGGEVIRTVRYTR